MRCQDGLRQLVETLPADMTAQRMVASEKALGTMQGVAKNQPRSCGLGHSAYNPHRTPVPQIA